MVKQVIVMRKDVGMRKGKMCAQAAHASMKVFFDRGSIKDPAYPHLYFDISLTEAMKEWIEGSFTKICVAVNSEQELFDIHKAAEHAGLPCSLILDAGKTEFKEPTYTAVAIGPAGNKKIDAITGHLKLL